MLEKVRAELARYAHPLFAFDAQPSGENVEVRIHFKPAGVEIHEYAFLLHPRDIEHTQFQWTFQRLLYDCLTDYIVELFTKSPMTG